MTSAQNLQSKTQNLKRFFFPWLPRGRERLVRDYFFISGLLIAGGLTASGLLEIYFRYHESRATQALLQREAATVAAVKIEKFIHDVELAMRLAARGQDVVRDGIAADYKFELKRLLFLAPAISEVAALSMDGSQKMHLSRWQAASQDAAKKFSTSPAFVRVKSGESYLGPVYLARSSEPYMTIAVPIEHSRRNIVGVLVAEVNLKYVWDVVAAIKAGKSGYAYAVSRSGNLVAHPDITLVLQGRKVSELEQYKAAFQTYPEGVEKELSVARNLLGNQVITASALIPRLDWAVLIEMPVSEVYETLYGSVLRTSTLFLVGLGMALFASFFVARRVIGPLRVLGQSVDRIRSGDLGYRVNLYTGDELETLAEQFNAMTEALQEAYTGLESKVARRTRELAVANERLKELDQLKSDFVSNVSHELRTPLTAIKGSTDNMLDGLTGPLNEKQMRYLMRIKSNADRLGRFVNDVLDLSKIEAGKLELHPGAHMMDGLITEVTDNLRPLADGKAVRLEVVSRDPNIAVWADRDKLAQVLTNLIGNAIKFSPVAGQVNIGAEHNAPGFIRIFVADSGPGIAAGRIDKVFDKFYQADHVSGKKGDGTGLGLTICKAIVELHGGKIWLESSLQKGTTVFFTLPEAKALLSAVS